MVYSCDGKAEFSVAILIHNHSYADLVLKKQLLLSLSYHLVIFAETVIKKSHDPMMNRKLKSL